MACEPRLPFATASFSQGEKVAVEPKASLRLDGRMRGLPSLELAHRAGQVPHLSLRDILSRPGRGNASRRLERRRNG